MLKFAFIGGTIRGYKLIEALLKKNYLPEFSVILKEDDHEIEKYSDKITELMDKKNIPNSTKKKLTEQDYSNIIESKLDFVIVCGWRTLIDSKVNKHLKLGFIAAHQSLLPKYRGFAPTQWVIINGETETGVTLFLINEGETDSGKIISQRKVPIMFEDNASDLDLKLADCTIKMFLELFKNYEADNVSFKEQNEEEATYSCKRIPDDGKIDWNKSSFEIYNLIRALEHPFPGAFCAYKENIYHIRKAKPGKSDRKFFSGRIPGRVISINKNSIEVLCGSGTIEILEWENKLMNKVSSPCDEINSITSTLK